MSPQLSKILVLGKTLGLVYILIRLLMSKTDVLFMYRGIIMMFYRGMAYAILEAALGNHLIPHGVKWSLIDVDIELRTPPSALVQDSVFPVQNAIEPGVNNG